ncbi:MAG: UDP-2,3-diacylglucosamine diphosphatase [bacterium]
MDIKKRPVDLVVLSDIHLGTHGCQAKDLLMYLKSIEPKTIVLNGDIIDVWQFKKRYWPKSHMKILKHLIGQAAKGIKIFYITGNHDEVFRKFSGLKLGSLQIVNHLTLDLDGKKTWFFHGDVFDVLMKNSKWLMKIGAIGYDFLIFLNIFINSVTRIFGKGKISLSKKIKENVKKSLKYINDFEESAAKIAIKEGYDNIVCGHVHQAQMRRIKMAHGEINYMNPGDWIENLTSLEYHEKQWKIMYFMDEYLGKVEETMQEIALEDLGNKEIFQAIMQELTCYGSIA